MLRYGYVMAWGLGGEVGQQRSCGLRTQVMLRYGYVMAWGLVRCVGQKRSCDLRTQVMLCYGYVMACQVCGAHAKLELLIFSCFREFVFGNGDGTMEIPRTT